MKQVGSHAGGIGWPLLPIISIVYEICSDLSAALAAIWDIIHAPVSSATALRCAHVPVRAFSQSTEYWEIMRAWCALKYVYGVDGVL